MRAHTHRHTNTHGVCEFSDYHGVTFKGHSVGRCAKHASEKNVITGSGMKLDKLSMHVMDAHARADPAGHAEASADSG